MDTRLGSIGLAFGMLLGGCAVGPEYVQNPSPVPDLPGTFSASHLKQEEVERLWWKRFGDPLLDELISSAMKGNRDLRVAEARWREARSGVDLAGAELFPTGSVEASYEKTRRSRSVIGASDPATVQFYSAGASVSWELDVFGGVRAALNAARADMEASAAAVHSVQVAVAAEVARTYLSLRGSQARLALAKRNAQAQEQTLRLTQTRLEIGRGNAFDVARAQSQYDLTVAMMPTLESLTAIAAHRLAVLVGLQPRALAVELLDVRPAPATPLLTTVGTPQQLLKRRPDIQAAERRLASYTAQIGIATADLYPHIGFVGGLSTVASHGSGLGKSISQGYTIMPGIRWDVLDLGRTRVRIAQADARTRAAFAEFERVTLVALEETENALAEYGANIQRRESLLSNAAASGRAATLARQRYRDGATSFLDVLDAERSLLLAQDQLAQTEQAAGISLVAVYAALGGGWTPSSPGAQQANGPSATQ